MAFLTAIDFSASDKGPNFLIIIIFSYSNFAFPETRRTIIMHILEMHIIEWMGTYNAGLGLIGTEAIHAHFKQVMAVWQSAVAKTRHARAL